MTVPLINLPSPFLTDEKVLMPLGLLYMGSSIEMSGMECIIIDLANRKDYIDETLSSLDKINADVIGIGLTSSQVPIGKKVVSSIRQQFPKIKIIGGGPHVTHVFQSSYRQPVRTQNLIKDLNNTYDVLVIGDAEKAIHTAIKSNSPKLIDATIKNSPYYVDSVYLNELPYPARHLLDMQSYHYNLGHKNISESNAINIISQRGCPYSCRFCAGRMDQFSRIIRKTHPGKVIREIEYLYNTYGYTDYTFYDDELNVNSNLKLLLDNLKDLQMKINKSLRFRCFVRANLVTKIQIKELADTGFKVIAIGAESGSDKILKNMSKKVTVEENTRVIEWAKECGIYTKSIMSLGHPGESPETLSETEKWLDKVQLDDVNFTLVECLPSSVYYDNSIFQNNVWVYTALETGDKLYDVGVDWTETIHFFNADSSIKYESTVYTDYLKQEELVQWHRYFEKKYK